MNRITPRILFVPGALVFVYFVMYPEDLSSVIAPIASILQLSQSVSPWLYMVIGVGIITWGIVRVWGGQKQVSGRV